MPLTRSGKSPRGTRSPTLSTPVQTLRRSPVTSPHSKYLLQPFLLALALTLIIHCAHLPVTMPTRNTASAHMHTLVSRLRGSAPADATTYTRADASTVNRVGLTLFRRAASARQDVVLSPVGLAAPLAAALLGAAPGSAPQRELAALFGAKPRVAVDAAGCALRGVKTMGDGDVRVLAAVSLWAGGGGHVHVEFAREVEAMLGGMVQEMELQNAVGVVNAWVREKTDSIIEQVVDEIEEGTAALLVSAIFFRGKWKEKFEEVDTRKGVLFRQQQGSIGPKVGMMQIWGRRFRYGKSEGPAGRGCLHVLEMPYGDEGRFAATILFPDEGAMVDEVVVHVEQWDKWMGVMSEKPVQMGLVALPRFRVQYGAESLKDVLKTAGILSVWPEDPTLGKFAKMTDDDTMSLSDVLHKVVLEVTEEGTTAAAASAAYMSSRSMPEVEPPRLIIDAPFLFAVRDTQSGLLLFLGRIDNPKPPVP